MIDGKVPLVRKVEPGGAGVGFGVFTGVGRGVAFGFGFAATGGGFGDRAGAGVALVVELAGRGVTFGLTFAFGVGVGVGVAATTITGAGELAGCASRTGALTNPFTCRTGTDLVAGVFTVGALSAARAVPPAIPASPTARATTRPRLSLMVRSPLQPVE